MLHWPGVELSNCVVVPATTEQMAKSEATARADTPADTKTKSAARTLVVALCASSYLCMASRRSLDGARARSAHVASASVHNAAARWLAVARARPAERDAVAVDRPLRLLAAGGRRAAAAGRAGAAALVPRQVSVVRRELVLICIEPSCTTSRPCVGHLQSR